MASRWEFSVDGGRTWGALPPKDLPPTVALTARGTFEVADPAAVAMLWVAYEEEKINATFCLGTLVDARGKNCGALPIWSQLTVTLNGKEAVGPLPPMMYHFLPIVPAGGLVKGVNTLTLTGPLVSAWQTNAISAKPLKLLAAGPQKPVIRSGPTLGAFGEDFFTVTCRTNIPATVTAESGGKTVTTGEGLYHRMKVPLAKGTLKFSYRVTAKTAAGESSPAHGPFEVQLPDPKGFRFVALGNTRCNQDTNGKLPGMIQRMADTKPNLWVHAGQVVELGTWDYKWDPCFFSGYASFLATVPTYLAGDGGDHTGMVAKTFWTPAADGEAFNWTQAIGDVRLIGLDGAMDWAAGSANMAWLEGVLKDSKEKYVFVVNHFPGYASGMMAKMAHRPLVECRNNILPLMAKYNASALISAYDFDYERCEATPPRGVTCIVVGAAGAKRLNPSPTGMKNNPFYGTGPFIYQHVFALFEVTADAVEMKAIDYDGKQVDQRTFKPRR